MNPYPYPNYWNNGNQYQPNIPMYQQPMNTTGLAGKFINDSNEISVNDVPMTGKYAIFPKSDMSEIICKAWNQNGVIQTISFVPHVEAPRINSDNSANTCSPNMPNEQINGIMSEISALGQRLDKIEQLLTQKRGKQNE